MTNTARFTPLLMAMLYTSCIQHVSHPHSPTPIRATRSAYTVHRDLAYTPPSWPQRLETDVYVPAGAGPFPGVLVVHGGGWGSGQRTDMTHIAKRLAARGYTAVNLSYRFAPTYHFPAQIEDLQQAVRWMRQNAEAYRIDPDHIGAFGYSAGGHLAAMLGTISPGDGFDGGSNGPSTRIQAVVAGGAPTDLRKFRGGRLVPRFLGTTIDKNLELFARASPIVHVSPDDPPMFFYHGSFDTLVDVSHAYDMKQALDAAGVPAELYIVRGLGHIALFVFNRSAVTAGIDFLDHWLRQE